MNTHIENPETETNGDAVRHDHIHALVVEDNPGDARLIQFMLNAADAEMFEVEHVDRLTGGIERLANGGIDIVLADLSLPDSHGLETFFRLRGHAPRVPIIVLSGLNDTTVAVNAVHEGAQDYLVKGQVDGQSLARAIRYAIERKRMSDQLQRYAEELREKNAQLEADFNMARDIQQIFLPNQYPTLPRSVPLEQSAVSFSHRYLSAAAVGGDFFDLFALSDSSVGMLICDVMGHGMRAALITAIMRGLIEELMPLAADPGKFLVEINRSLRAILRRTHEPFLATAFYGVADVASGELRFSGAGHPSPYWLRRSLGSVQTLNDCDRRHGPALGLFEKSDYPNCRCPITAGDLILLYTDGIYEATNPNGEEFGQDRLRAALQRKLWAAGENLFDDLIGEVRRFSEAAEFDDDVCLVGMEIVRTGLRT